MDNIPTETNVCPTCQKQENRFCSDAYHLSSKEQVIRKGVDAALAGVDDYIGRDWGDILCFARTLAVEVRRLRAQVETAQKLKDDTGGGCSICGALPVVNVHGSYWLCGSCVNERLPSETSWLPNEPDEELEGRLAHLVAESAKWLPGAA